MPTEEFVLIPKQMWTSEQPQMSRILDNPFIQNKGKVVSLLQRKNNSVPGFSVITPPPQEVVPPPAVSENAVQVKGGESIEMKEDESPERMKPLEQFSKSGGEMSGSDHYDQFDEIIRECQLTDSKLQRAIIILKELYQSKGVAIQGGTLRIIIEDKTTTIKASTFLHNTQQTTKKLRVIEYRILHIIQIKPELTVNTYAKSFLSTSTEKQSEWLGSAEQQDSKSTSPSSSSLLSSSSSSSSLPNEPFKPPKDWKSLPR